MEKYKAYFKNGNIDIEHTILIIYSLCWGAPFIINKLGYIWLLYISRAYHSVLLLFFVSLVLLVINGYILYIVIRKFLKAIRQRKIAFILIIFYLFIAFLQATVFWLGFTFLNVTIFFILIVIILIYQFIVNRKKTEWITKNFKKEVAIELIELDNIKQDE